VEAAVAWHQRSHVFCKARFVLRVASGPSEADRVYAELLKKGATPAIVAKQRKDAWLQD